MIAALLLVLVACADDVDPTIDASVSVDAQVPIDADAAVDAPTDAGPPSLTVPFRASLAGATTTSLERFDVTDNVGTVTIDGTERAAFAPQTVDWSSAGYRLVHLFSTTEDDVSIAFVYCRDDEVVLTWYESLTTPLGSIGTDGTRPCTVTHDTHAITYDAEPFERVPDDARHVTGFAVDGDDVHVATDGTGTLELDGIAWDLLAFEHVDCTAELCGDGGWHELHSLLRGPDGETAFVILYLLNGDTETIRTGYGIRLDTAAHLSERVLPASWSHDG